ncbi:MAG: histidine phosphatase family protein [Devosia sp.]|uniref:histidine phosphatase family protein n=1 Tax=Devosia sp. TaxID=1871048 RepID=UPI0024CB127D|nr:histidine phosphatase family protein [Devosia sp.]UYN99602.1 MAG: histidine phosphatase family protein [Devosia sp.]
MAALSAPDPMCHKRAIDSSLRTRRPARDDMTALVWPEIYFIRHGETPWNAERRYQGRRDIPLNEKGKGQASLNGKTLARLFASRGLDPTQFEWHASPLGRTRETMERVRMGFTQHLPEVKFDVRLMEISFGVLEGSLHEELPANMAVAPGQRDETYWDFRPENGENYRDVEARLTEFAGVLNGPSVVVAHGGIARTLRVLIERAPILDVINWPPPQDTIMHFTPGKMELIRASDL